MSLRLSRLWFYTILLALVIAGGVAHGLVTDRWVRPSADEAARLDLLPMTIEDWGGSSIEPDAMLLPEIDSGTVLLRRYVNRVDGSAVVLFLTVGRAGPIVSEHRPDSCYPGAGFVCAAPLINQTIPVGSDERSQEFTVATFGKTERASPLMLRIFWSWTATGDWESPQNPRLTFLGQRRVYKVYVIRPLAKSTEPLEGDAAVSFIRALVPEFKKVFFPTP